MSAHEHPPLILDMEGPVPAAVGEAGTSELVIVAYGQPAQQGDLTRNQYGALYHSNKKLKPWRATVADAAREAMADRSHDGAGAMFPRGVGVYLGAVWTFPRSGAHFGSGRNAGVLKASAPAEHVHSPDLDKLLRAIFDALTDAGVWHDDRQVVRIVEAARVYPGGHPDALTIPGVTIRVRGA